MLQSGKSSPSLVSEMKIYQAHHNRPFRSIASDKAKDFYSAKPTQSSVHHVRRLAEEAMVTKFRTLAPSSSYTTLARPTTLAPIIRPQSAGAFKPRKLEPTRFRYFYDRGDLPVRINFAGAVRKLQWQVEVSQLDYSHYLPMFMEGLRDLQEPYHFLALNGTLDMVEKGGNRVLPCLPRLISPMKANLMTRNQTVLCLQMKVLQRLVHCCPYIGEALVPYYRQLLSVFNLFITKRVNCGDLIDYAQRRQENIGDLILETLNIFEKHGGPDAFVNIKYMIPTYESCMTRR